MRKISFVRLCLSVLILFSTFACEKNDVIPPKEATTQSDYAVVDGVLTFSSDEACQRTVEMVNKMTEEERLTWEKSINFRSLGTVADQFFYSIDFDKFSTQQELINFFNTNSDKLVVETKNGEYYFEPIKMGNANRYIMNQHSLYVIGKIAHKELKTGVMSAPISKMEELKAISDTRNTNSPMFIIPPSDYHTPGSIVDFQRQNSKYLLRVTISSIMNNHFTFLGATTSHEVKLILRNYEQNSKGNWISHRSTTSCYYKIRGAYKTDNGEWSKGGVLEKSISEKLCHNHTDYVDADLTKGFYLPNVETNLTYYRIVGGNWKGCVVDETWGRDQ